MTGLHDPLDCDRHVRRCSLPSTAGCPYQRFNHLCRLLPRCPAQPPPAACRRRLSMKLPDCVNVPSPWNVSIFVCMHARTSVMGLLHVKSVIGTEVFRERAPEYFRDWQTSLFTMFQVLFPSSRNQQESSPRQRCISDVLCQCRTRPGVRRWRKGVGGWEGGVSRRALTNQLIDGLRPLASHQLRSRLPPRQVHPLRVVVQAVTAGFFRECAPADSHGRVHSVRAPGSNGRFLGLRCIARSDADCGLLSVSGQQDSHLVLLGPSSRAPSVDSSPSG